MLRPRSPVSIVLIAVYLCAAAVVLSIWMVSRFPEFGVEFAKGPAPEQVIVLAADGRKLAVLKGGDLVTFRQGAQAVTQEARQLLRGYVPGPELAAIQQWYAASTALTRMTEAGPVQFELGALGPHATMTAKGRALSHLGAEFWVIIANGLYSSVIGAWVFALRPKDWGARFYGLTAAVFSIAGFSAAVFEAREFAADGRLLWLMSVLNYTAT